METNTDSTPNSRNRINIRRLCVVAGIAATLIAAIAIVSQSARQPTAELPTAEAETMAQDAVNKFFNNLNKGISQMNAATDDMDKANNIIKKQLQNQ